MFRLNSISYEIAALKALHTQAIQKRLQKKKLMQSIVKNWLNARLSLIFK